MSSGVEQLTAALAGRYAIERLIGEGGMATVYLARDLRHDRSVALKVLKPELGAVLGVERFLAEIKVTAHLQHPNLLPLFDSGEAAGLLFYVMPFVQGESLRARLEREKQLPIDEAVRIASAVASALDYAHRHGVIHRDLKPENILLHDGQPQVADFGIALAVSNAGGTRVTQTGLSLGTPQYMSPEQAAGDRVIDGRSDIYSLASVTFEMIAGEPPHSGGTAQAIIAKLMTQDPPALTTLRRATPAHVEAAVAVGLSKLPADRFATAREYADALTGKSTTALPAAVQQARRAQPVMRHPLVAGLATLAVVATGLAVYGWYRPVAEERAPVVRFDIDIPPTMLAHNAGSLTTAVSPDGLTLAYVGATNERTRRLYIRPLNENAARSVPRTDEAQQPTFSPDGRWIAYFANDQIWKVPVDGGQPVALGASSYPLGLTWSLSGEIIVGTTRGLVAIPATGGTPRTLARPDSSDRGRNYVQPYALDDGATVLFINQESSALLSARLASLSLRTGEVRRYDLDAVGILALRDGILVYVTPGGALNGVGFDAAEGRITTAPVSLGPSVLIRVSGAPDAVVSRSGMLVYHSETSAAQVGWVSESGEFSTVLEDVRPYSFPRLSPDGNRFALTVGSGSRSDVWIYDLRSATASRLTSDGTLNERAEWTPDGRRVLYRSDRSARSSLWWQAADLSDAPTALQESDVHDYFEGVITPDGGALVYQIDDGQVGSMADVMYRRLAGDTTSRAISTTAFVEAQARVSPDGRWVAYVTNASGREQVVVQPFPGPGPRVQVSADGGGEPVWSRDGSRLFYRDGLRMIVATYTSAPTFAVTSRRALFNDTYAFSRAPHANYDVAPDGRRFLMLRNADNPRISVVYNWWGEVVERMSRR